jgi:hypothetical protein
METSTRLESVRVIVDEMLLTLTDANNRRNAYVHLYGVSNFAALIAMKRELNQEIAAIAGLLHDYYLYKTGIHDFHDQSGAEAVRPILRDMGIFSLEEQKTILSAIFLHSDKSSIHSAYDEVIKDAEVLQIYFYNYGQKVNRVDAARLNRVLGELSLPVEVLVDESATWSPASPSSEDKRAQLADVAETLASKGIVGIPGDFFYREICRYWPDSNIYQGLKDSWCAAFVYYCCRQVGFLLPIRYPNGVCRFAGVAAWQEWAQLPETQFFHSAQDKDFTPQRGDILIYEKLLSDDSHDHIGIVLACDEEELLVAEGNMDNKNQSKLVRRDRWSKLSGFVRIRNDYQYKFVGDYNPQLG